MPANRVGVKTTTLLVPQKFGGVSSSHLSKKDNWGVIRVADRNVFAVVHPKNKGTWVPMTYVKPSTIPGAGKGLFAAKAFKKDEYIGRYHGKMVDSKDLKDGEYVLRFSRRNPDGKGTRTVNVDGRGGFMGRVHMANDKSMGKRGGRGNNATFTTFGYLKALRPISKHGEIFVYYGDSYDWSKAARSRGGASRSDAIVIDE